MFLAYSLSNYVIVQLGCKRKRGQIVTIWSKALNNLAKLEKEEDIFYVFTAGHGLSFENVWPGRRK